MDEQNVNTVVAAHDFDRVMAFDKLNEEMNSEHSPSEDIFHNWLCEQMETDDELIHGVLKSDRTIKGALKYCSSKAIKLKTDNVACVDDQTVFGWVREYYVADKVEIKKSVPAKVVTSTKQNVVSKTKKPVSKNQNLPQKENFEEQLTLFD
mgnify:FL=1